MDEKADGQKEREGTTGSQGWELKGTVPVQMSNFTVSGSG